MRRRRFFIYKAWFGSPPGERRQARGPDNRDNYPVEPVKRKAAFRSAQDFFTILKDSSNK